MESQASGVQDEASRAVRAVRLWGPVRAEHARSVGALAAATSVLLKPTIAPEELVQRLRALIPAEVLPRADDNAETLRARLSAARFFPPTWVLYRGNGKGGRYVELSTTTYSQPRRLQWAEPIEAEHVDADGDRVVRLPIYPHYYTRSRLDAQVRVPPPAVRELAAYAAKLAAPVLTPESRSKLPNACELCMYYTAFDSSMGRHRDNFVCADLAQQLLLQDCSTLRLQRNTQQANTNVLIWTLGNAEMVLQLSFPPDASKVRDRSKYVLHPAFKVPCSNGTLFVFSPTDDLFFCHEAFFEPVTLTSLGASGYRCAFVMRWLSNEAAVVGSFYADGARQGEMKVSSDEALAEAEKVKKRGRNKRRKVWG